MKFAHILGKITGPIILTALYLIIGIYGIVYNAYLMFGKKRLSVADSNWQTIDKRDADNKDYFHQF